MSHPHWRCRLLYLQHALDLAEQQQAAIAPPAAAAAVGEEEAWLVRGVGKNLAYAMEHHGGHLQADQLLARLSQQYPQDGALRLLWACLCPPHSDSVAQARQLYERVGHRLAQLLQGPPLPGIDDPVR